MKPKASRRKRWLAAAGVAAFGYALAAAALSAKGLDDHLAKADLIVVPGNKIDPDGTPCPRLRARLDIALDLFRAGWAPRIFVSGGTGAEGFDEAIAMKNYLVKAGVPPTAVVVDSAGIDTAATATNASRYLRTQGLDSALVASQYFHVPRTAMALEHQGVRVAGGAHARYWELRDVFSLTREVAAYAWYRVRG